MTTQVSHEEGSTVERILTPAFLRATVPIRGDQQPTGWRDQLHHLSTYWRELRQLPDRIAVLRD